MPPKAKLPLLRLSLQEDPSARGRLAAGVTQPISTSSVGRGADVLSSPWRALRTHNSMCSSIFWCIMYSSVLNVSQARFLTCLHCSFWSGSFSATIVLRNYTTLSASAVVLWSRGTCRMYVCAHVHACVSSLYIVQSTLGLMEIHRILGIPEVILRYWRAPLTFCRSGITHGHNSSSISYLQ